MIPKVSRTVLLSCLILLPAVALGGARVEVREKRPFVQHLTDADGRALYRFTADTAGESKCYGRCNEVWPLW